MILPILPLVKLQTDRILTRLPFPPVKITMGACASKEEVVAANTTADVNDSWVVDENIVEPELTFPDDDDDDASSNQNPLWPANTATNRNSSKVEWETDGSFSRGNNNASNHHLQDIMSASKLQVPVKGPRRTQPVTEEDFFKEDFQELAFDAFDPTSHHHNNNNKHHKKKIDPSSSCQASFARSSTLTEETTLKETLRNNSSSSLHSTSSSSYAEVIVKSDDDDEHPTTTTAMGNNRSNWEQQQQQQQQNAGGSTHNNVNAFASLPLYADHDDTKEEPKTSTVPHKGGDGDDDPVTLTNGPGQKGGVEAKMEDTLLSPLSMADPPLSGSKSGMVLEVPSGNAALSLVSPITLKGFDDNGDKKKKRSKKKKPSSRRKEQDASEKEKLGIYTLQCETSKKKSRKESSSRRKIRPSNAETKDGENDHRKHRRRRKEGSKSISPLEEKDVMGEQKDKQKAYKRKSGSGSRDDHKSSKSERRSKSKLDKKSPSKTRLEDHHVSKETHVTRNPFATKDETVSVVSGKSADSDFSQPIVMTKDDDKPRPRRSRVIRYKPQPHSSERNLQEEEDFSMDQKSVESDRSDFVKRMDALKVRLHQAVDSTSSDQREQRPEKRKSGSTKRDLVGTGERSYSSSSSRRKRDADGPKKLSDKRKSAAKDRRKKKQSTRQSKTK